VISSTAMISAKAIVASANGTGTSRRAAAAMEAMSAPMLKVLAAATSATAPSNTGRAKCSRIKAARPLPVTSPSRAVASCTAMASGRVASVVHSSPKPKAAPTWE
jgi:hypothetical protein